MTHSTIANPSIISPQSNNQINQQSAVGNRQSAIAILMKIVYFGTPEFAVPTLRALIHSSHRVVAVVSQPDRPRGRGQHLAPTATKVLAEAHGVRVFQPERIKDEGFLPAISALEPDLGVVAAYGKLLPDALLQIPKLGMINVHASLLPRWRGAAPVHRAVIAGDRETGVTIMRVVKELDAGPVFATLTRPIGGDETSPEVERDLAESGASLLLDVVDRLARGEAVETPQDPTLVTYAPKIVKSEGAIDWGLPAAQIHNLVRGLQPWPLVSARLGDTRVLLHRTALTDRSTTDAGGTIVRADRDALEFASGDGRIVRIEILQPEGRRAMMAREFLAGRTIPAGSRLERG
jgi:methionyl-tRNA formyltransferase